MQGAAALRRRNPRWISSGIAKDGLPERISSIDKDGTGIGNPELIPKFGTRNDFAKWLRDETPLPETGACMNCWEAVLTSAHLGGLVSRDQLVALYRSTAGADNPTKALLNRLGRNTYPKVRYDRKPTPGDIIVMDNDKDNVFYQSNVGFHVFIAAGEEEEETFDEELHRVDYAYSHDKSDRERSKLYNSRVIPGVSPFLDRPHEGSEEWMVYRNRQHVVDYVADAFAHQNNDRQPEIRYLHPDVFLSLEQ